MPRLRPVPIAVACCGSSLAPWASSSRVRASTGPIRARPNPSAQKTNQASQTRRVPRQRQTLQAPQAPLPRPPLPQLRHPRRRNHPPLGRLRPSPQTQVGQTNRKKIVGGWRHSLDLSASPYRCIWPVGQSVWQAAYRSIHHLGPSPV
jgi:hypothetical protein